MVWIMEPGYDHPAGLRGGPDHNRMAASLHTSLTQDYPATASLTRQDLESLLAGWDPSRADATWYRAQTAEAGRSGLPSASNNSSNAKAIPPGEEAFEAFIDSLPQVQAMRQESQRLLKQSEEKAARNVTLRPTLEGLRAETQSLYDRALSLQQQWPHIEQDMAEAYKRFAPSTLLFSLTQSASKLHDESESLASAFVEGLPLEVAVSVAHDIALPCHNASQHLLTMIILHCSRPHMLAVSHHPKADQPRPPVAMPTETQPLCVAIAPCAPRIIVAT